MNKLRTIGLVLLTMILTACGSDFEYTRGKCYLVFDNSTALVPQLAAAMNAMSPGVYCHVYKTVEHGMPAFAFEEYGGQKTTCTYTAAQQQMTLVFGRMDESGVIVGFGVFGDGFVAYDMQCQACSALTVMNPRTPLTWKTERSVECKKCGAVYDLTTGYSSEGKRLTTYRASTTGPFGLLSVH